MEPLESNLLHGPLKPDILEDNGGRREEISKNTRRSPSES